MAVVYTSPAPFQSFFRAIDGDVLNQSLAIDLTATYSGLTALSGGGTTGATPLLFGMNQVATTAATNDSVKLPAAQIGATVIVSNAGTSTLAVFPQTADKINGGTAGASVTQATVITGVYVCPLANNWYRVLSA